MHMADALISPAVGGTVWAASAGLIAYCSKKVRDEIDDRKIPLMGVAGAFIFAAQMINFTIPGTGSSGHLGGAMILAILLGPYAAFLTMASILTVQALLFADGGLLALGCNIFNLGFFPCFIAYPLIYKPIVGYKPSQNRILLGAIAASVLGLQMGAFGVVIETLFSGLSELPFKTFVLLMQPIHLAIGIVEGIVTAAVVSFVWRSKPELLQQTSNTAPVSVVSTKYVLAALLAAALITGGIVSWFASSNPDGLEWAVFHTTGKEELETPNRNIYSLLGKIQEKTALLPDYGFRTSEDAKTDSPEAESIVSPGTSVSGLVGGAVVLALAAFIGFALKKKNGTR
ncbi:MAG: cobalamin biosynthesis protein CbiM [Desulfobacteraceae bacterium]|nr:MAG: cobalamin biosynthesis protein CbiM [Desulfobacteraceae bacterium]